MMDAQKSKSQIGQFGVGFYSAYLIADKVTVITKKMGHPCYVWESNANGTFTITEHKERDDEEHGTQVILHLKEDQAETYLDHLFVKDLIKKHNEFIMFPIYLVREVEDKKVEKHHINQQKPLWTLPSHEVTHEQYASFYKSMTKDWNEHLAVKHFSVEVKGILYIPRQAPFDVHDIYTNPHNIRLYVKRVFITDDAKALIPPYLCFLQGMVDCDDLPLNISREFLQNNKIIHGIKKSITKKAIELMRELAEEDYMAFYKEFSRYVKLGIYEDAHNRGKLEELLRYKTTFTEKEKEWRTFAQYRESMKPHQKGIFYVTKNTELFEESEENKKKKQISDKMEGNMPCIVTTDATSITAYAGANGHL